MDQYRIRITKDYLIFSAAHFITFGGHICERLHGHNYRVEAEISGDLDENYYVFDFIAVRDALQEIVMRLDHHVLLPTQHTMIHVSSSEHEVEATFENKRWVFPREDCVLLPVPNTTAELLAKFIGEQLLQDLKEKQNYVPGKIRISVDENNGQWADWIRSLSNS